MVNREEEEAVNISDVEKYRIGFDICFVYRSMLRVFEAEEIIKGD